jgi:hypothetical protein
LLFLLDVTGLTRSEVSFKEVIEVFKKCGTAIRTVLNMDGTTNTAKLASAVGRRLKEWIS